MDIIQQVINDESLFRTFHHAAKIHSSADSDGMAERMQNIQKQLKESIAQPVPTPVLGLPVPKFIAAHIPPSLKTLALGPLLSKSVKTMISTTEDFLSTLIRTPALPSTKRSDRIFAFIGLTSKIEELDFLHKNLRNLVLLIDAAPSSFRREPPITDIELEEEELFPDEISPEETKFKTGLKRELLETYWQSLKLDFEILTEMLSNLSKNPPITEQEKRLKTEVFETFLICLKQISHFTQDTALQNPKLLSLTEEDFPLLKSHLTALVNLYSKTMYEESVLNFHKDSFSAITDESERKQATLEIATMQLFLSKAKLFLTAQRMKLIDCLLANQLNKALSSPRPLPIDAKATFNQEEKDAFAEIQRIYSLSQKELLNQSHERKRIKRQYHRDLGRKSFPIQNPSGFSRLLNPSELISLDIISEERVLDDLIRETEVLLLSPVGVLLLDEEIEPEGGIVKALTSNFSSFSKTVTQLKYQIRDLKLKIDSAYRALQSEGQIRDGTPTAELLARSAEGKKTTEITHLEKDLNLVTITLGQALMTRLIDLLGAAKNCLKKSKKEIEQNEKKIHHNQALLQVCDKLIEAENHPTPGTAPLIIDEIVATTAPEVIDKLYLLLSHKNLRSLRNQDMYRQIKQTTLNETKALEILNEVKREENKKTEQRCELLQSSFSKMIIEYEAQYNAQPSQSFKEAILESTKNIFTKILSFNFINNDLLHPREIRAKKHYADLGYSMHEEVENFIESLAVKHTDGETWQSAIQKEIKEFLNWAEKHPYSAANMAADIMQVGAIVQSTVHGSSVAGWISQFFSTLKTKIYVHALLNTAGYSQFEPLDNEKMLRYRALADLVRYAPVVAGAIRGGTAALSADSFQGMLISGIGNAFGQASVAALIQHGMNQISSAYAETSLRIFRLIFNALRSDGYVDSVIEQRNLDLSSAISNAKEALIRPAGFIRKVNHHLKHWWKSVKYSAKTERNQMLPKNPEFWLRICAQLLIPVIGLGSVASTLFLVSPAGAYLATVVFGGTVGYSSILGVSGFVAFSIYQTAYRFGRWLNENYPHTQRAVRRQEGIEICEKNKEVLQAHVKNYIEDFHERGILPIVTPSTGTYPLQSSAIFISVKTTLYKKYLSKLIADFELKKRAVEASNQAITMRDCVSVYNQLSENGYNLNETVKKEATILLKTYVPAETYDEEALTPCLNQIVYEILNDLENAWLKQELTASYRDRFIRVYIESFEPGSTPFGQRAVTMPEDILKQETEKKLEEEHMDVSSVQDWIAVVNQAAESIRKIWARPR